MQYYVHSLQYDPQTISPALVLLWCASFGVALTGVAMATMWYIDGWKRHPFVRTLLKTGLPARLISLSLSGHL